MGVGLGAAIAFIPDDGKSKPTATPGACEPAPPTVFVREKRRYLYRLELLSLLCFVTVPAISNRFVYRLEF